MHGCRLQFYYLLRLSDDGLGLFGDSRVLAIAGEALNPKLAKKLQILNSERSSKP